MRPRSDTIAAWDRKYKGAHPRWRGPADLQLDIGRGERALELGCGDGKTLSGLLGEGSDVIGLDFSRPALLSARKRLEGGFSPHLVQADCLQLPFASHSLDHIVANHVLEHLREEERPMAAAEIVRTLRPGGWCHVGVFGKEDLREGKGELIEPSTYLREGISYHYFSEPELLSLFQALEPQWIRTGLTTRNFAGEPIKRSVIRALFRKGL